MLSYTLRLACVAWTSKLFARSIKILWIHTKLDVTVCLGCLALIMALSLYMSCVFTWNRRNHRPVTKLHQKHFVEAGDSQYSNNWIRLSSPCLLVWELFQHTFTQVVSQSFCNQLSQLLMRISAKNLNVRHIWKRHTGKLFQGFRNVAWRRISWDAVAMTLFNSKIQGREGREGGL